MIKQIINLINESNSICLMTHMNPDGDAVGSVLAMESFLSSINKSVDVILENVPQVYSYLDNYNKLMDKYNDKEYDLCIVLDCASKERISLGADVLENCKMIINIDHHITNTNFGDINYIEKGVASCTQILFNLFKTWNIEITNSIGNCLITGLITDTCGFRNNNVTKDSYLMAAELSEVVDIYKIYDKCLTRKSMAQFNLINLATERLEFLENGKIAFTYVLSDDFEKFGAKVGDHEGIVDIGRGIDGVEVSIFLREDGDNIKISWRSNGKIRVNEIAKFFDGGGHDMAAGGISLDNMEDAKKKVILKTIEVMNEQWMEF